MLPWRETEWEKPGAYFVQSHRRAIRVVFSIGTKADGRSVATLVARRHRKFHAGEGLKTMAIDEHEICDRIAKRASIVLKVDASQNVDSLTAIRAAFDGQIVADMLGAGHASPDVLPRILDWLHELAQQTYENRSLSFACILTKGRARSVDEPRFPDDFLKKKRYKVLSDGFRTAYEVGCDGRLRGLTDLRASKKRLSASHWFPEWSRDLARASASSACAIALTWQGDIIVLERGTLRFTYRFGTWQYWNHRHLTHVLESLCRRQRVPHGRVRTVVASVYRAALDASFRRTGALFVVLGHRKSLRKIVRMGDAIDDSQRDLQHQVFDRAIGERRVERLSRVVLAELASLDGAVVIDGTGRIQAYGAVLNTRNLRGASATEGARTKAAMSASRFGLALKVSSDGGISAYFRGRTVFEA
jgi:DNA integrity scanning protein DisA with diadenylate cyclase activity